MDKELFVNLYFLNFIVSVTTLSVAPYSKRGQTVARKSHASLIER
jgi:hypothetical protein